MNPKEQTDVTIPEELHIQVRNYCSKKGIPFLNFLEEALENAMYLEDQFEWMEKTEKMMADISRQRRISHVRGFREGFIAAFFLARGNLGISMQTDTLRQSVETNPYKIVEGSQMSLFD